ncbi:MAG: squalene--hopene cyclase, partial [Candidatus Omnitrophica bacterium]|nr:squalene--hopene cyclase [Candidatus Omnitrophota bacterium]
LPPELILLPTWCPFNIYEVSAWSRTILVPLAVLYATRPSVPIPLGFGVDELWADPARRVSVITNRSSDGAAGPRAVAPRPLAAAAWRRVFLAADVWLKVWERTAWKPWRRRALRAAERWLLERLVDADGLGAIYPAMVNAVFALKALGYQDGDPILERAIHEVERLEIVEGETIRVQPCCSPVWDTALAAYTLAESGPVPGGPGPPGTGDDPALARANRWLRAQEIRRYGDWAVKNPAAAPGGWAFEFLNAQYPDVDDTAMVALALGRVTEAASPETERAIQRGVAWILSMQNRDGGWSSFDKNNDRRALTYFPFADHNAMLDPSASDITGRVLELLGRRGMTGRDGPVRRAVQFLRDRQEPDGAWFGRWGVNYVYGSCFALRGLKAVGESLDQPRYQQTGDWLAAHQNADGGWGETIATYDDPSRRGQGTSTAAQTAWAVMALAALGRASAQAARRGVEYLLRTQPADGAWVDGPWTGTGFPGVFYLRYHLYSVYFPLLALSEVRQARGSGPLGP